MCVCIQYAGDNVHAEAEKMNVEDEPPQAASSSRRRTTGRHQRKGKQVPIIEEPEELEEEQIPTQSQVTQHTVLPSPPFTTYGTSASDPFVSVCHFINYLIV